MKGIEEAQKAASGNATANPWEALGGIQDLIPPPPGMGADPAAKRRPPGGKKKKAADPDHDEL